MRAEMQHGVRAEILAQPTVESGKGMRRGEAALEQQAHRIALIAERRLQPDEHIAELRAQNLHRGAIRLQLARRRAPACLDLLQPRLARDDRVGADLGMDIGFGPEARGIALQNRFAQRIDRGWNFDLIAFAVEPLQRRVERRKHAEELRRTRRTRIGWEVEQDDRDALLGIGRATQRDDLADARGEHLGALGAGVHRADFACRGEVALAAAASAGRVGPIRAPAEHHRDGAAVEFGDRDHHRRFEREQALPVCTPGLQRLEFDRVRRDVRHVELGQHRLGGGGVVIGWSADHAEAGEVYDGIDDGRAVLEEQCLDRGTPVEPARKGRDHVQPARLHRGDHAVIVPRVLGEDIGAQHQHADRALGVGATRQSGGGVRDAVGKRGVIDANFGIVARGFGLHRAAQGAARAIGIAIDQTADHVDDIVVRCSEPILHRQEIGAHVLRGAGDELQEFGEAAQDRHLPRTRTRARFVGAAQFLDQGEHARGGLVHAVIAHAGGLDHVARRHQPDHCVARFAARLQLRQHRLDMILEEQHRREHDVAAQDVRARGGERLGLFLPVGGGVEADRHAGIFAREPFLRAQHCARQMIVECHDDDAHRGGGGDGRATGHNAPSRHRGCRA